MEIELVGCTSAGKSTLIRDVLKACSDRQIDVVLGDDFILQNVGLRKATGILPRGILINTVALLVCLITWRRNQRFYAYAARLVAALPIRFSEKLYIFRNVLKKVGAQEIIRHFHDGKQVVLVDEGVLQVAHNLFVHQSVQVDLDDLSAFVKLISLPDVVVYLRQPESLLIDRITRRGHTRISDRSAESVTYFVRQAVAMFEELIRNPAVVHRLLIIDHDRQVTTVTDDGTAVFVERAAQLIRNSLATSVPRQQA